MNWSIREYENVEIGDRWILSRISGDDNRIVGIGHFAGTPKPDKSWRKDQRDFIQQKSLHKRLLVPEDGEMIGFKFGVNMSNHHEHSHAHHHHHHHGFDPAMGVRFILAIIINLIYVAGEFYLGFRYDSVGLLADAGHNLSDVGGLLISLLAFFMLKKHSDKTFTYGYKKATVLAAFINSLMLMSAVVIIIYECIEKFLHGSHTSGIAIILTAGIGILVNGFTVFLLSKGKEHDLNVKSAYLHMLSDTLVSCGVVLSGGIIMWSQWSWIDPIIGLLIAGIILRSSWGIFKESIILTLDGVPHGIDPEYLQRAVLQLDNVTDIHHIHIRSISTTENELTAHIKLRDISLLEKTKNEVKEFLQQHNIHHSTLEFET